MADIEGLIVLHEQMDQWGPFSFDLGPALPPGAVLASASVAAYLLADGQDPTESTADLIDGPAQVVDATTVHVWLQWPGSAWVGKHRLVFSVDLSSGSKASIDFEWVSVRPLLA